MERLCILCTVVPLLALFILRTVEAAPKADLVKRLPGQPKVSFKQYAGYVTVDEQAGRALFYYFVEAEKHPDSKPLALWLNGGPGCSSIGNGAFEELGPFRPNGYGTGLVLNKYAWNKASNLLFLESPAGVGFSYSNTTSDRNTNDSKTAEDSLKFLLGWFEKFPEYKTSDFFVTGESYAGHYVPQLVSLLLKYNDDNTHALLNLKGVAIGNPLLNIQDDSLATFTFWWSHGLISEELYEGIMKNCNFNDYEENTPTNNEPPICHTMTNKSLVEVGHFINYYDVELDVCYSSTAEQSLRLHHKIHNFSLGVDVCMDNEIECYFNLPKVQKALHANMTHLSYNWTLCSSNASLNYSQSDPNIDMKPYLKDILKHGLRLLVYSGELDSVIPLIGTRQVIKDLTNSLNLVNNDPYRAWYKGGQVGGWTSVYGNLTYATVRGAGHMVPTMQPTRALFLYEHFLKGKALPLNKFSNSTS